MTEQRRASIIFDPLMSKCREPRRKLKFWRDKNATRCSICHARSRARFAGLGQTKNLSDFHYSICGTCVKRMVAALEKA